MFDESSCGSNGVQGWRWHKSGETGTGRGHSMQSLLCHSSLFLKDYLKPLINVKHGKSHSSTPIFKSSLWRQYGEWNGVVVSNSSPTSVPSKWTIRGLISASVHSRGFSLLISLTPFVESGRFNFVLCLWDRNTERDNGNRWKNVQRVKQLTQGKIASW